jgi:hypothetical protein
MLPFFVQAVQQADMCGLPRYAYTVCAWLYARNAMRARDTCTLCRGPFIDVHRSPASA